MDEDGELEMRAPEASQLSAKQLGEELERRHLKPTGFPEDDVRLLQQAFDAEFEKERDERVRQMAELRARKRAEEETLKLQRFIERQKREEDEAIAGDPRVAFWMDLLHYNKTPECMTLRVDPVVVRAFAKSLGRNTSLKSLDVCNGALQDDVGTEFGMALRTNKSLLKLDLDYNAFGPKSLLALAAGLLGNTTLQSLSLERNPLTQGSEDGPDYSGLRALAEVIQSNTTLVNLNLFQVGLGGEGGHIIAEALRANTTLVALHVSIADGIRIEDLASITDSLQDNARLASDARAAVKSARAAHRKAEAAQKKAAADETIKEAEEKWLVAQRERREREQQEREFEEWRSARMAALNRETEHKERVAKWKSESEAKDKKKKSKSSKKR